MTPSELPSALDHWGELVERLDRRPPAVFLDFDGTLAPIAPRPELAAMSASMTEALRDLHRVVPVAIITGRGLADIRHKVGLPDVYYAANHGFEIEGPGAVYEPNPNLRATFTEVAAALEGFVAGVDGAVMESKGYSVAVHYRLVDLAQVSGLRAEVERVASAHTSVRLLDGKKVIEVRPAIPWHKGAALRWIRDVLEQRGDARVAVFIGDDKTDEDALVEVRADGVGIFVGVPRWDTAAHFGLHDSREVEIVLRRLTAEFGAT